MVNIIERKDCSAVPLETWRDGHNNPYHRIQCGECSTQTDSFYNVGELQ